MPGICRMTRIEEDGMLVVVATQLSFHSCWRDVIFSHGIIHVGAVQNIREILAFA